MYSIPMQPHRKEKMRFLNNLDDGLAKMKREMQTLPGELDSIMARLDHGKLQSILFHLEQDFDQLIEKHFVVQRPGAIILPYIYELKSLSVRRITNEDLSRWREIHKSKVGVIIGKGIVKVMAVSDIADKLGTTISQITPVAQERGYTVLSWDEYQRLFEEIGKLIN
jgi:hypothetical protein